MIGLISRAEVHSSEVASAGTSPVGHGPQVTVGKALAKRGSAAVCMLNVPAKLCIRGLIPRWCWWEVVE